jgi:predicted  nucleic acid-binding Zn-ribbon protein
MKILDTAMTEIVSGNSTRYYSKYVVAGKEHTETLNNFKYQNIINPNNEITIGNTCASSVTFSIYMPTVSLENKEITVFEGVKVNGEIQYIQLGIFTVTKQTSDGEYTSYEAYDRMYKADMPYFSDMTFPSTDKAILNEICSKLGISLATNIVTAHTINEKPQGYTYREIIGYMAMLQGSNAVINADSNLELRWYKDSDYVLDGHKYYQQGVTFTTSKDFIIQKLTCNNTKSGSTEQSQITSGDGATGLTFANPFMTQAILDEIYKKIGGFTFRPLAVKFVGDYRLEVGDIITVNKGGVDYKVPIMQITHECDGGLISTATSIGQSDTENTSVASGPITKRMERYYADLIAVNKALINKLDVDTAKITYATITNLKATNASIENLKTNKLDVTYAEIINANVESLKAANADITQLKANSLTADIADLKYAQIDFANVKGQVVTTSLIKDGAVTNEKVGNLSANKITSGEIDASKIKVYNLNADYLTVGYINGKRIGSGSIELDKLAEEVPTKEYLDKVQEELQGQIDGNIETFTKTEIPTLNNEPAVNWTDNAIRKKHIGDICYVVNPASSTDGYSYRFANTGTEQAPVYEWVLIKDSDVTKALQDIININGEITGIKKFNVEISSWKTDTDSELSSLKTRTTSLETDIGNKVDTTTFNKVKQTVDENSSTITKMSETLSKKADSGTVTTLSNTVNSIKQTTDSNTSSISSLTTTVTKVENTANSASKTATAANNTANTAKSTADSALSKVNTLTTTVTNQGSSITQLQGSITNKVWKTDITESVNNLQVGGTNMLLWTTTMPGKFSSDSSGASSKGTVSYQSDGSAFVINNNSNFRFQYHPDVNVMIGATYVVSAYYRDVSGAQAHQFQIAYATASGKYADFHGVTGTREVGDGWKQSYLVFTIPDTIKTSNLITVYLRSGADYTLYNHSYYIKNVKLELGNKVTTWSPAPEDVSSGINAVDTKVTTVSNQYTTLNQTVNSISATVNSHTSQIATKADNSTITTLNNKVTSLTTDLSGFKTTVSNTYATKNSLSNYATTAAMNSAISQSANSITQSVSATYATKSSLSSYATTASLSAYIAKTDTGTLKSCIEAIADTINITARGGLNLSGNRFTLSSTNTTITTDGTITTKKFVGNGGTIGGWNIDSTSIYSDYLYNTTVGYGKYRVSLNKSTGSDSKIFSVRETVKDNVFNYPFYVRSDGYMYSVKGQISGFQFDSNKMSNTVSIYLLPDKDVLHTLRNAIVNNTTSQLALSQYDLNGSGKVDLTDFVVAKNYVLGTQTEANFSKWKYAKKSDITYKLNPSDVKNALSISGTDIWGKTRQTTLGIGTLYSNEISCDNLIVKDPVDYSTFNTFLNTINVRESSTSIDLASFTRNYVIKGNGMLIVNISVWTDATDDYGTTAAEIYIDNKCVTENRHRMTNSHPSELAGGTTFVWWFNDNTTHNIQIKAGSSKEGTKTYTQSIQALFGLQIST